MGKPSPPTPTDPVVAANAQAAANADTARLQANLNNVNTYGPTGSVVYNQTSPDRWSQTTTLSPAEQHTYDLSKAAENQSLQIAGQQAGRVGAALGQPVNLSGLPHLESEAKEPGLLGYDQMGQPRLSGQFNQGQSIQGRVGQRQLQNSFDQGQQVQGQVGPTDFSADRNAVTDAVYNQARSRLDPQFAQQQEGLQTQLANQGLGQNSAAYQNAMGNFDRQRNDAYNQALYSGIQQGANEQNTLFGQRVEQGQFANQAAGQEYGQNLGAMQAFNTAQGQQFGQALQGGQFANQAAGQQFNQGMTGQDFANQAAQQQYQNQRSGVQDANAVRQQEFSNQITNANLTNQARGQGLQEQAYVQNLPINQLSALLGLGQVSMPQGAQGNTPVNPTDVLGAYALNQQQRNANYQSQMSNYGGLMGGLFNLGSSALMLSDRRLKRDIEPLGICNGHKWYRFRYLWSPVRMIGVMAQEVLKTRPEAVVRVGPWLAVDYAAL